MSRCLYSLLQSGRLESSTVQGGSHAESWSAFCVVLAAAVFAYPASGERGSWNNWHVHDGGSGTDANGLRHAGLAFFPQIFGSSYATTPSLWAYCTDATDKALVGGEGGAREAAGHCQNESSIIHLQVIACDAQAPRGNWTALTPSGGFTVYYFLTPR
jgi:hypothetical protein